MTHPLKVFLCHAHSDKDTVKNLYARLKREGVDVWLDKEKLLPGADWEFEIRKAVRESDVVIVCLSKQFNQAGFRQKEVRIALEEADNKPPGEIFIIPARLEECDNLPTLVKWHWVDLFENDGFQRLILALRLRAEKIGASLRQRGATQSRQKKDAEQREAEETAKREAAEKAERERLARAAEENAKRENAKREAAEKSERDRLAREAAENTKRENAKRERAEREKAKRELAPKFKPLGWAGVAGIAFVCLLLAFLGGNYLLKNLPSSTTEAPRTMTAAPSKTKTPAPTKTFTPKPPTFTPTPGIGSTMISEKDGMILVYVPAGEFTMGSDTGSSDEQPVHQVYLDAFWIDQTEVTYGMFSDFVEETGYQTEAEEKGWSYAYVGSTWEEVSGADWQHPTGPGLAITEDTKPVIHVSWNDAVAYCKWAGRGLPTEAQWEKAARGTDGRTYPWGDTFDGEIVNFCDANCPFGWADKSFDDGYADVSPVGSYPAGASIYGALDMAGNVWEWVSSLYQPYPYDANDGREDLSASGSRALRGGSWINLDYHVRSANRNWSDPTNSNDYVGFRCSLSHP